MRYFKTNFIETLIRKLFPLRSHHASELVLTKLITLSCDAEWIILRPRFLWSRVSLRVAKKTFRTERNFGRAWQEQTLETHDGWFLPFCSHLWFIVIIQHLLLFTHTSQRKVCVCLAYNVYYMLLNQGMWPSFHKCITMI